MPFVFRVIVQALLAGVPADVQAEAQALRAQMQASVDALGLDEPCPACRAAVAAADPAPAPCQLRWEAPRAAAPGARCVRLGRAAVG